MTRRPPVTPLLALLLVAAIGACDDTTTDAELELPDTEMTVHPQDFSGEVHCGNNPGSMRSYVATLYSYDDADDVEPTLVTSSIAVPCSIAARFLSLVKPGKRYSAEIDAYEARADELKPNGGLSSGSRTMLTLGGAAVTPRWTTRCGFNADGTLAAVEAAEDERHLINPCDPLLAASSSPTQLGFDPQLVFGAEPCALVEQWSLSSEDGKLPATGDDMPCSAGPLLFDAEPGERYDLYLRASTPSGEVAALCSAVATAQLQVPLVCEPLSSSGGVQVSLKGLLDAADAPLCPANGSFSLSLEGVPVNSVPLSCGGAPLLGPLAPGDYAIHAVSYDSLGSASGAADCTATVLAGKNTVASCVATP